MRTYTTSQVVRLLELHPDWEFQAPHSCKWIQMRASTSASGENFTFEATEPLQTAYWRPVSPVNRSDWTRVKPAKAKLERVKVAVLLEGSQVSIRRDGLAIDTFNPSGPGWMLYAVKEST